MALLFSAAEPFCYFGEGHYDKQFCEIHLEFGPVVQEKMPFKDISYLELWRPFCSAERDICAMLVKGIKRNNSVKLFLIWTRGDVV